MEEHKESLASELLHEIKAQSKRWFILFIIMIIEQLHISYDYARQLSRRVNKKILKII